MYANEKHEVQEILESNGYNVRPYSGRAMYGKSCIGVIVSELTEMIRIGCLLGESFSEAEARCDNMGLDYIIYWPYIKFVGEENEDENEDDD